MMEAGSTSIIQNPRPIYRLGVGVECSRHTPCAVRHGTRSVPATHKPQRNERVERCKYQEGPSFLATVCLCPLWSTGILGLPQTHAAETVGSQEKPAVQAAAAPSDRQKGDFLLETFCRFSGRSRRRPVPADGPRISTR